MKLNIIFIFLFFWPWKQKKIFFLGLILRFSHLNVLHKGLLMQDWVFRLGLYYFLFGLLFLKVPLFWERHKILRNLHQLFDWQYRGQIVDEDIVKFCGLLRIFQPYIACFSFHIRFGELFSLLISNYPGIPSRVKDKGICWSFDSLFNYPIFNFWQALQESSYKIFLSLVLLKIAILLYKDLNFA